MKLHRFEDIENLVNQYWESIKWLWEIYESQWIENKEKWIIAIELDSFIFILWKWVAQHKYIPDWCYWFAPFALFNLVNFINKKENNTIRLLKSEINDNLNELAKLNIKIAWWWAVQWKTVLDYSDISDEEILELNTFKDDIELWIKSIFSLKVFLFEWNKFKDFEDYLLKTHKNKRRTNFRKPQKMYSRETWFDIITKEFFNWSDNEKNIEMIMEEFKWIHKHFLNKEFVTTRWWNSVKFLWDKYLKTLKEILTQSLNNWWRILLIDCFHEWRKVWSELSFQRNKWWVLTCYTWFEFTEEFNWLWKRLIHEQMEYACKNNLTIDYSFWECWWKWAYKFKTEDTLSISAY